MQKRRIEGFMLQGFIAVPRSVFYARNVSWPAKNIYMAILSRVMGRGKSRCWPSQEKLAEEMGVSTRTVRRLMEELVSVGLIEVEQRGQRKTNVYHLLSIEDADLQIGGDDDEGGDGTFETEESWLSDDEEEPDGGVSSDKGETRIGHRCPPGSDTGVRSFILKRPEMNEKKISAARGGGIRSSEPDRSQGGGSQSKSKSPESQGLGDKKEIRGDDASAILAARLKKGPRRDAVISASDDEGNEKGGRNAPKLVDFFHKKVKDVFGIALPKASVKERSQAKSIEARLGADEAMALVGWVVDHWDSELSRDYPKARIPVMGLILVRIEQFVAAKSGRVGKGKGDLHLDTGSVDYSKTFDYGA